jgi:hypothetical protein
MSFDQRRQRPDVDNLELYIQSRARTLLKLSTDHVAWDEALKASVPGERLLQTWIGEDGTKLRLVLDRAYLSIHWRIMRSLILDLADCGSEGKKVLKQLVVAKPSQAAS